MRFVTKFRNQIWQVFDTHRYMAVRARPLRKQAEADAEYLNNRPERPQNARRP